MFDRYTWDEADLKVESVINISLGTQCNPKIHQRSLYTMVDIWSTNELVYKLGINFTRPRNLTFDSFQLITVQQKRKRKPANPFSRLRELCSKIALGNVEEDLIKDFFIAKMIHSAIQMELLSEVRTPAQVLNSTLSRERGLLRSKWTNY